jgi:hypothetical protein
MAETQRYAAHKNVRSRHECSCLHATVTPNETAEQPFQQKKNPYGRSQQPEGGGKRRNSLVEKAEGVHLLSPAKTTMNEAPPTEEHDGGIKYASWQAADAWHVPPAGVRRRTSQAYASAAMPAGRYATLTVKCGKMPACTCMSIKRATRYQNARCRSTRFVKPERPFRHAERHEPRQQLYSTRTPTQPAAPPRGTKMRRHIKGNRIEKVEVNKACSNGGTQEAMRAGRPYQ